MNCPTVRLCIAVGRGMEVSTRPGRAGSWHRIDNPRTAAPDLFLGLSGIACASARLCLAADDGGLAFVSTDPTGGFRAWHVIRVHGVPRAFADNRIACTRSRTPVCVVAATQGWLMVGHGAPRQPAPLRAGAAGHLIRTS